VTNALRCLTGRSSIVPAVMLAWSLAVCAFSVGYVAAVAAQAVPINRGRTGPPVARVGAGTLEQNAHTKPMPAYPASSVARRSSGVAVAVMMVNQLGSVESVKILQAPDADIAAAVEEALKRWTFGQTRIDGVAEPAKVEGKIVLYFRLDRGKGVVVSAADATPPASSRPARVSGKVPEISVADLAKLSSPSSRIVLDPGPRESFAAGSLQAINIPFDELPGRAGAELSPSKLIVIVCQAPAPRLCVATSELLQEKGYGQLALLR
jgi:TonB family protein